MARRGTRKRAEPRQGEALLDGLFRRLGLEDEARDYRALAAWHVAAGPLIARRTRAEAMFGTTMVVRATTASWVNELGYMKRQLLESLHATPGGERVEELRFTVGPIEGLPSWEDEEERRPAAAPPAPAPPRLDDVAIADALRDVTDPELRAALAELYARARARR